MKPSELRESTNEELIKRRQDLYQEIFNLRTQLVTGQLQNYKRVKEVKKDIAKIYTILKERKEVENEKREGRGSSK